MKPEIHNVNDTSCHLFYGNFLVVNLPHDKMDECLQTLNRGELFEYPRGAKRVMTSLGRDTNDENNPKICKTFVLDENFSLLIKGAENDLVLQRAGLRTVLTSDGYVRKKDPLKEWLLMGSRKREGYEPTGLREWLACNLETRGYQQAEREQPFYKQKDTLTSAGLFVAGLAAVALFYQEYQKVQDYGALVPVGIALVVSIGALVFLVKKALTARSFAEPVYTKGN